MGKILIACDTSSGINVQVAKENNIVLIPMSIEINGKTYLDQVDINNELLCNYLKAKATPKTSQPNLGLVEELFEEWKKSDYEVIMLFTCSSDLSGTNHSYHMLKNQLDMHNMIIIDTRSIGAPIMDVVLTAKKLVDEGEDIEKILNIVDDKLKETFSFLYPLTLDQLTRSGRLSPAASGVAKVLKVKPLLYLKEDGSCVDKFGLARTEGKVIQLVVDKFNELGINKEKHKIYILHAENKQLADKAANILSAVFDGIDIEISELPACLATHGGYGCVAVQSVLKNR